MNPVIAELLISAAIALVYWRTRSWLQEWDCAWRHGEHHTPALLVVRDGEVALSTFMHCWAGAIHCRKCGRLICAVPLASFKSRPQWDRALENITDGEWAMYLRRRGTEKVKDE